MTINPVLKTAIKESGISVDDGLTVLLAMNFGLRVPEELSHIETQLLAAKIIVVEGQEVKWFAPMFEGMETAFEWVVDWIKLFKTANPVKTSGVKETTTRMKKFFAQNPDIRKDEVIAATEMYIRNTEAKYLMLPTYFIFKGKGAETTYTLLNWIDRYRNYINTTATQAKALTNTMQ